MESSCTVKRYNTDAKREQSLRILPEGEEWKIAEERSCYPYIVSEIYSADEFKKFISEVRNKEIIAVK